MSKKTPFNLFWIPKILFWKNQTKNLMRTSRKWQNPKLHTNRKKTAPAMLLKISQPEVWNLSMIDKNTGTIFQSLLYKICSFFSILDSRPVLTMSTPWISNNFYVKYWHFLLGDDVWAYGSAIFNHFVNVWNLAKHVNSSGTIGCTRSIYYFVGWFRYPPHFGHKFGVIRFHHDHWSSF